MTSNEDEDDNVSDDEFKTPVKKKKICVVDSDSSDDDDGDGDAAAQHNDDHDEEVQERSSPSTCSDDEGHSLPRIRRRSITEPPEGSLKKDKLIALAELSKRRQEKRKQRQQQQEQQQQQQTQPEQQQEPQPSCSTSNARRRLDLQKSDSDESEMDSDDFIDDRPLNELTRKPRKCRKTRRYRDSDSEEESGHSDSCDAASQKSGDAASLKSGDAASPKSCDASSHNSCDAASHSSSDAASLNSGDEASQSSCEASQKSIDAEQDDDGGSSSSGDSGQEASQTSCDWKSQLDEVKKDLARQTYSDKKNKENYTNTRADKTFQVYTSQGEIPKLVDENDKIQYQRLALGLRKYATKKNMTDIEVLMEWVLYQTSVDYECSGKCVCGKTKLKYLNWMHNKNIKDDMERTFTKICIGSECINWFNKNLQSAREMEIDSPIVLFDAFNCKGVRGMAKKYVKLGKSQEKALVISLSKGRIFEFIWHNFDSIQDEYKIKMKKIVELDCVELTVRLGTFLRYHNEEQKLDKGNHYRFFLTAKMRIEGEPPHFTKLVLVKYDLPGPKAAAKNPDQVSVRSFIK